jgi:sugar phosphate isomerase/epimerase
MIRFGGPVFINNDRVPDLMSTDAQFVDPVKVARRYREKGFTSARVPHIDIHDKAMVKATKEAFKQEDVMLAEIGYWDNLLDTDGKTRSFHRGQVLEALYAAEELGALCAVDILGSYCHGNGNSVHVADNFSGEAFESAVEIARYFIDMVKPKTAYFVYEIFPFDITDTPENLEKLLKAVDRKQFGIHLDLCNLINSPRAYFNSGAIVKECVHRFGDRIISCHVKDIKMKEPSISVILEEVPMGQGNVDLKTFMRQIDGLSRPIPFMMEHLPNEAAFDAAAAVIRSVGKDLGIKL